MQNTSQLFNIAANRKRRELCFKAILRTSNGATHDLTEKDIDLGSVSLNSAIMSGGFEIGGVIASDFSMALHNRDGRWTQIDFDGATLIPYSGFVLENGAKEYVPLGMFIVDHPRKAYGRVTLKAADRLILLDEPLSSVGISWPTTHRDILAAVALYCKIPLAALTWSALNLSRTVEKPLAKEMSCRDAIAEIAALAGGYAKMNRLGELEIKSLAKPPVGERITWGEKRIEGVTWGELNSNAKRWQDFYQRLSATWGELKALGVTWSDLNRAGKTWSLLKDYGTKDPAEDDIWYMPVGSRFGFQSDADEIVITGMEYQGVKWGSDEYVLVIDELNFLKGDEAEVRATLDPVWEVVGGMSYTPYSAEYPGNPAMDTGDLIWHKTRDGRDIISLVTKHSYKYGGKCIVAAEGKTPEAQKYKSKNERRLAEVAAKAEEVRVELGAYKQESAQLSDMMALSLGVYRSEETLDDGSKIYYFHDKPKREESKELWKFNGKALAFSDDGGVTWPSGWAGSKLVMRQIIAEGIEAEWVRVASNKGLDKFVTEIGEGRIKLSSFTKGQLAGMELGTNSLLFDNPGAYFRIMALKGYDYLRAGKSSSDILTRIDYEGRLYTKGAEIIGKLKTEMPSGAAGITIDGGKMTVF